MGGVLLVAWLLLSCAQTLGAATGVGRSGLPSLCRLRNASFHLWDSPTQCKGCTGEGSGSIVPGDAGECDGVVMQSVKGMAASFMTEPFLVEPTVVYNVSYEVRTTGLVATTAYLTGGVYAQFFDQRADFNESTSYNNEKVSAAHSCGVGHGVVAASYMNVRLHSIRHTVTGGTQVWATTNSRTQGQLLCGARSRLPHLRPQSTPFFTSHLQRTHNPTPRTESTVARRVARLNSAT